MTQTPDHTGLQEPLAPEAFTEPPSHVLTSPKLPPPHLPHKHQAWHTKHLRWRIMSDATAAVCASGLVSPIITIIDRSIIERASSKTSISSSILTSITHLLSRPHHFLLSRPFLLIHALYFSTYLTANTIDTLTSTLGNKPSASTTTGPTKFLATTSVNMSLCLYKDSQFARMFGAAPVANVAKSTVPATSYALFALRDSLTIFASFNLPPLIAPVLPLSREVEKHVTRKNVAQFLAPAGIQLLSTPLHLWGLDLYNRPMGNGTPWEARLKKVGRDWLGSSAARMARVVPAFGVGGVVNANVRSRMLGTCEN